MHVSNIVDEHGRLRYNMPKGNDNKERKNMIAFGVRFEEEKLNFLRKLAAPAHASKVIRALVDAVYSGEIKIVIEDGEFKVKK